MLNSFIMMDTNKVQYTGIYIFGFHNFCQKYLILHISQANELPLNPAIPNSYKKNQKLGGL